MAPLLPHLCACLLSDPPFVPSTSLPPSSEYCSLVLQALQLEDTIQNSKREDSRRFESSLRAPRQGAFALLLDVAGERQRTGLRRRTSRHGAFKALLLDVAVSFKAPEI